MRAVNLIPRESARARIGSLAPYALIGGLTVALIAVLAYVLTHNTVVDRRAQVASLETQAQAMQQQAAVVKPYREFASMAQARVQTVRQLGAARFDWHRAFHDLATVLPDDVWLTSLLGTVTTGVTVEGASSGTTGTLRSALPNPAIEMTGCTTGQQGVARLMSRLRLMSGVVRISLADSVKTDAAAGSSAAGGADASSGDCTHGSGAFPKFGIVIFFDAPPAVPTAPSATGVADASATATPSTAGTTPPATGTSSSGSDIR